MGLITRLVKLTTYGGVATVGAFFVWTRNSRVEPLPTTDALFQSAWYRKYNPEQNPPLHDVCVRTVPLSQIDPKLLEKKGKLVEAFCAGVWGGLGYSFQRAYLSRKYRGPQTEHQLWSTHDLRTSTYPVGTQITDHFEVIEHTNDRIVVRCGDSPLKRDVRPVDGLFEMAAAVKPDEGVAEFQLKSVFFQGLGKAQGKPMPPHIEWLHQQYAKLWMESALQNVVR
ncbi:hypothetical protein VTN77DRAFT_6243 [Rasamsonia byssochlamydoides]|uniref:uncharacterized protein n=1 Tax=Rasamsonia byssochlamydoides TaxID=89139 RepID=UPI00374424E8